MVAPQGLFLLGELYSKARYQALGKAMAMDFLLEKVWDYFNDPLRFHEARAFLRAEAERWEREWKP